MGKTKRKTKRKTHFSPLGKAGRGWGLLLTATHSSFFEGFGRKNANKIHFMRCTQIYVPLEIPSLNYFRQTTRQWDGGVACGVNCLSSLACDGLMPSCYFYWLLLTTRPPRAFLMTFSVFGVAKNPKWKCARAMLPQVDPLHYGCRRSASPGQSYFTYLLLDHLLSHWRPVRSSLGSAAVQRYLLQLLLQLCHLWHLQYQLLLPLLLRWLSCCPLRRPRRVYWATSRACWQL